MSWDIARPSRRLLIRNLPSNASNQSLHDYFCRYGEVLETFVPIDPQTRRPRAFGFVEFRLLADAQLVKDTVAEIDGSRVSIVFVEAKRNEEDGFAGGGGGGGPSGFVRGSFSSSVGGSMHAPPPPSAPVHSFAPSSSAGGRLQPPPVAPPPPVNPNTETYRYNTMAGEFIIDASGRLTRRRDYEEIGLGESQEGFGNRTNAGLGGGLLVASGPAASGGEGGVSVEEMEIAETSEAAPFGTDTFLFDTQELDQLMKPSEVVDFADI